ncbi:M56 family metallopeptidase [Frateuria edaphi]|uniref:M56 family metallopeptidase n=1 Tax=Frateuria edaphi TaxID=2898793 RepID=UPI001E4060E2|nr:M56 family metallopeptidase [Frateuria edaphi]UGB44228.1 M56 family metallopeptidase [Frateuria edaphi]
MHILPDALKAALALTLLHSVWQVAALALLAGLVLAIQSTASAKARHATGMAFLLAMVLLPMLTLVNLLATHAKVADAMTVVQGPLARVPVVVASIAYAPANLAPLWLPWVWTFGVATMLLRLCGGWWMVRRLDRKACDRLPAHWHARAEALRQSLDIRRQVAIRLLRDTGLPCSAYAWRPVIWLPLSMLTRLSPDQIEALIAHELAHIRRLDWIWNSLQCLAEALLFYHPGMWWLSRRIRQERENACDDLAVAACGDAIVLAEALNNLERLRVAAPMFALSAKGGVLMQRIKRLLFPDSPPHRLRLGVPLALLAVACSGALYAAQANHSTTAGDVAAQEVPHWWNTVGHSVHIVATVDGHLREYRQWSDMDGRPHESYTVDDRPSRIDAKVREWLAVAMKPPAPPVPPAPPPPPVAPPPPAPPAPPLPPRIETTQAYTTAIAMVQRDARVSAILGTPIGAVTGPCALNGDAFDCSIMLSGPQGIARLQANGERRAGQWRYSRLEVLPERGDAVDVARRD